MKNILNNQGEKCGSLFQGAAVHEALFAGSPSFICICRAAQSISSLGAGTHAGCHRFLSSHGFCDDHVPVYETTFLKQTLAPEAPSGGC